jgi:hypothetical protein
MMEKSLDFTENTSQKDVAGRRLECTEKPIKIVTGIVFRLQLSDVTGARHREHLARKVR